MNVIGTVLNELYRIFDILNRDKFDGALKEPVITIQKGKGLAMGYFTLDKVWVNKDNSEDGLAANDLDDDAYYEINIDPRYFYGRDAIEIVGTLLHEMVHYYNKVSNVKDCSGNIHNKKFKAAAENVGLIVTKGKSVGWGYTMVSDELSEYIMETIEPDEAVFEYFRAGSRPKEPKKRKKSLYNFTCPKCGQVAKAKNGVVIKCGTCDVGMDMEDIEDEESEDNLEESN